jgi:integrase
MANVDILALWDAYGDLLWEKGPYREMSYKFLLEMQAIVELHSITAWDNNLTDTIRRELRKKGNKNSSINRKIASLSKVLRKHQADGHIDRLPDLRKLPEQTGRTRFLDAAEQRNIFETLDEIDVRYGDLVRFLVNTGARFGEVKALKWIDVTPTAVIFWNTKNGSARTIPLTKAAQEVIRRARERGMKKTGPFADIIYATFRYNWTKARKICGLAEDAQIVPHVLRHTCASRLAQSGIDVRRIQEFLGHKSIEITMRYAHLHPKDLEDCLPVLEQF